MPRPILDERITIRLPECLLSDCLDTAARRNCSVNEVVLNALENEFARLLTYRTDYYRDLRPLWRASQGDNGRPCQSLSDTVSSNPRRPS